MQRGKVLGYLEIQWEAICKEVSIISPMLKQDILEQVERLSYEQQQQLLDLARAMAMTTPKGVPGKRLLSFAGAIAVDDLQTMEQAIEESCERVDLNEW